MGLFDKLESAAGAAAAKGKEVASITKLNAEISSEEKNITKTYVEIGKAIFESAKDDMDSPVYGLCQKIITSQLEIERLKAEIEEIKK